MATKTRLPTGIGANNAWTSSIPSANKWEDVDDAVGSPDDATAYLFATNAVGGTQQFTFTAFDVPDGATINSVKVKWRARRSGGTVTLTPIVRTGTTNRSGTAVALIDTTWTDQTSIEWTTNPATSAAWNVDEVNGTDATTTHRLTEFGALCGPAAGRQGDITQIYVEVDYTEGDPEADLTGTIIGNSEPRMDTDIVVGGRTILLTLTSTTWAVAAGSVFDGQRQNIINGLTSATSPANGWNNEVKTDIAVTDVVRTSDTVVTITLPAVAAYALTTASETITATVPATAVAAAEALVAPQTFTIHPTIATSRRGTSGWGIATIPNPGGDYLTGPAFVTDDGFLVSAWIHQPDSIKGMPWQLGQSDVLSDHWRFITATSEGSLFHVGKYSGGEGGPPTEGGAALVTPILQDRWIHACGAWLTGSVKYAWLYGNLALEGTQTEIATPATPTSTRIGVRMDHADGMYPGDQLAEISAWDITGLTIAQIRTLVTALSTLTNGLAPNPLTLDAQVGQVWTGKLISYPDLDKTSGTWKQDLSGNHAAYTEVGTLTTGASYPPVAAFDAGGGFGASGLAATTWFLAMDE